MPQLSDAEREAIPESWRWLKVSQLGSAADSAVQIGPMSMRSSEFVEAGVPVLNVGTVQDGYIEPTKRDFLPVRRAKDFARYRLHEGDVLFTRSGTVGRCAVLPREHDGSLMTFHLLRVRADPAICLPSYLWCAFNASPSIRRQRDEAQIGSTRAGFNTTLLADLDVPIPPIAEQHEIVLRVDDLLNRAGSARERIRNASERVETCSHAVLRRALRPENLLGSNGASSEENS